jgi:hypothetical protein
MRTSENSVLPGTPVNKGKRKDQGRTSPALRFAVLPRSLMLASISEVAELARFKPVEHQLKRTRLDGRATREGMVQDADGKQYQGDHRR